MLTTSGDRPPCTHKNCLFIIAARGRQSNESMHSSYIVSEYFILPIKDYITKLFHSPSGPQPGVHGPLSGPQDSKFCVMVNWGGGGGSQNIGKFLWGVHRI